MRRLVLALALGLAAASTHAAAGAQQEHRAAVVVELPSGETRTACVLFKEPSITGIDLLTAAQMDPKTYGMGPGSAVCKLCDEGCPQTRGECLSCDGGKYWQYYRAEGGGGYQYSNVGAGSSEVTDGDVDGWHFGREQVKPVLVAVDVVCSDPARTFRYEASSSTPAPSTTTAAPTTTATAGASSTTSLAAAPTTRPATAAAAPSTTALAVAGATTTPPGASTTAPAAADDAVPAPAQPQAAASRAPRGAGQASGTAASSPAGIVALGVLLGGIGLAMVRSRRRVPGKSAVLARFHRTESG